MDGSLIHTFQLSNDSFNCSKLVRENELWERRLDTRIEGEESEKKRFYFNAFLYLGWQTTKK